MGAEGATVTMSPTLNLCSMEPQLCRLSPSLPSPHCAPGGKAGRRRHLRNFLATAVDTLMGSLFGVRIAASSLVAELLRAPRHDGPAGQHMTRSDTDSENVARGSRLPLGGNMIDYHEHHDDIWLRDYPEHQPPSALDFIIAIMVLTVFAMCGQAYVVGYDRFGG
jgi:hypothetical protein